MKSRSELSEFEKYIKRRIQIHLFHRNTVDAHVFNNIANGIILQHNQLTPDAHLLLLF